MKKVGIINRALSEALARLGHTQLVVIADPGLPLPENARVVDLSLELGFPRFETVLTAVAKEIVIEGATIANEARGGQVENWVQTALRSAGGQVPGQGATAKIDFISHEELKAKLGQATVIVRTGEITPWANVILRCGVAF